MICYKDEYRDERKLGNLTLLGASLLMNSDEFDALIECDNYSVHRNVMNDGSLSSIDVSVGSFVRICGRGGRTIDAVNTNNTCFVRYSINANTLATQLTRLNPMLGYSDISSKGTLLYRDYVFLCSLGKSVKDLMQQVVLSKFISERLEGKFTSQALKDELREETVLLKFSSSRHLPPISIRRFSECESLKEYFVKTYKNSDELSKYYKFELNSFSEAHTVAKSASRLVGTKYVQKLVKSIENTHSTVDCLYHLLYKIVSEKVENKHLINSSAILRYIKNNRLIDIDHINLSRFIDH